MSKTVEASKKRTTVYIAPEVLEYLAIRRAKGAGSVSQQLENLVREKMPRPAQRTLLTQEELMTTEARDVEGYQKRPQQLNELEEWLDEQVWEG